MVKALPDRFRVHMYGLDSQEGKLLRECQFGPGICVLLLNAAHPFNTSFCPHSSTHTHAWYMMEEAAEEGESRQAVEEQGEEAGSQPSSDGCGAVVFRLLRGILATLVFYFIEPFVFYGYMKSCREHFTPFEDAFFMSSAFYGMLGYVVFLSLVVLTGFSWGDPSVSPDILLLGSRLLGNFVSSIPAFRWATFEAMWGFDYYGDADVRKKLSWWSLGAGAVAALSSVGDGFDLAVFMVYWGLFMYPVMISFERDILLSDRDTLCPGPRGDQFIGFRTFELYVVVPLVYIAIWFMG